MIVDPKKQLEFQTWHKIQGHWTKQCAKASGERVS